MFISFTRTYLKYSVRKMANYNMPRSLRLSNGMEMPVIGLGTYNVS